MGGGAQFEVTDNGGAREAVRLPSGLDGLTLEGGDAPIAGADLDDPGTYGGRPPPGSLVVRAIAAFREIPDEEVGQPFGVHAAEPVIVRIVRLLVDARREHDVEAAAGGDLRHALRVPAEPDRGQLDQGVDAGVSQLGRLGGGSLGVVEFLTA